MATLITSTENTKLFGSTAKIMQVLFENLYGHKNKKNNALDDAGLLKMFELTSKFAHLDNATSTSLTLNQKADDIQANIVKLDPENSSPLTTEQGLELVRYKSEIPERIKELTDLKQDIGKLKNEITESFKTILDNKNGSLSKSEIVNKLEELNRKIEGFDTRNEKLKSNVASLDSRLSGLQNRTQQAVSQHATVSPGIRSH